MHAPIRIILPNHFDNSTVNAWLFKGDHPTLVDTGMKSEKSWKALNDGLAKEGLNITDLEKIVVTHGHADHIGLAAQIAEASGAKVWVPEYVYPWATDLSNKLQERCKIYDDAFYSNADQSLFPYHSWGLQLLEFWDPIPEDQVVVFKNDDIIQLGDHYWQTIYTPGHCINQVVFYQSTSKEIISADMILKVTPVPYLDAEIDHPNQRHAPLKPLLNSFETLKTLDIEHVYPGHFDIMGNPKSLIVKQVTRIEDNIRKCLKWVREGHKAFGTLINLLYPKRVNDSTFFMTIAILDYLVNENLISRVMINGQYQYRPIKDSVHSATSTKISSNEF